MAGPHGGQMLLAALLVLLVLLPDAAFGFAPAFGGARRVSPRLSASVDSAGGGEGADTSPSSGITRRSVLATGAILVAAAAGGLPAAEAAGKPIVVLGANGQTGVLCVLGCLARGKAVRAVTRSGEFKGKLPANTDTSLLQVVQGDVSKPDTLRTSLADSEGVIFASSANFIKGTSKTQDVDNQGVINTAEVCIGLNIPRLVVISAGTVTRPKSFGYKATNIIGDIMHQKILGEDAMRALYAKAPSSIGYTVVRPGGLDGKEVKGVAALELNQGDTIGGIVSRPDLAEVCIECLSRPSAKDTTFELYQTPGKPVEKRFPAVSGNERKGKDWDELFNGLIPDSKLERVA